MDILQTFVKDLIGIDFEPEKIETEKKFAPSIGDIDFALDIFAEDSKHRAIIEIQRVRYGYHFDRFLHYYLAAIVELAKNYKLYKLDRTVYTIVWLTRRVRDPLYQHSLVTTTFQSVAENGDTLSIYPHRLYFLNSFYPTEQLAPDLADWLCFVEESITHPNNPQINEQRAIFHKASDVIDEDGLTSQERAAIIDEREYEEKRRQDWEDALQEGMEKGMEQGMEQGMEKGEKHNALNTARKMLAKGYAPNEITELTGLTSKDITDLQQQRAEGKLKSA